MDSFRFVWNVFDFYDFFRDFFGFVWNVLVFFGMALNAFRSLPLKDTPSPWKWKYMMAYTPRMFDPYTATICAHNGNRHNN